MKRHTPILILLMLVVAVTSTAAAATIDFDRSLLRVSLSESKAEYSGFKTLPVSVNLSLPAMEYRLELPDDVSGESITAQVTGRSRVGTIDPSLAFADITTAAEPSAYSDAPTVRTAAALGTQPIHLIDVVHRGNKRFARLLVFPLTVDSEGNCYFNRAVQILVGERAIDSGALVTPDSDNTAMPDLGTDPTASPSIAYLIVTSQSLKAPADSLCCYRKSIGIPTEVEVIEDILAQYTGRDDAEKLRERLKEFGADGGRYVLLAGDETIIPIRYAYPYSTSTAPSLEYQQICDLYYADLNGEWDVDNDNIWGEKYVDDADLDPELIVGRLPFNTAGEFENYLEKLIIYETNPGMGSAAYLERSFFFSSDQMRDYGDGGQHRFIASAYPGYFDVDTVNGVELASGSDTNPTNQTADQLLSVLSSGYGIMNIIAHGANDAFGVRTTAYNEWPKSYLISYDLGGSHGDVNALDTNNLTSFYYSLACDNGGFDFDQPPFSLTTPNIVQQTLGLKKAGAVGFVANSRWGWVSSSYLLQATFFEYLFANPDRPAAEALYNTKADYAVYRDQVFGLNYFGDPTMKVYTETPGLLTVSTSLLGSNLVVLVSSTFGPAESCDIIISQGGEIVYRAVTAHDGKAIINLDLELNKSYKIAALKSGCSIGYASYTQTVGTDVDDEVEPLPSDFSLSQNYPNPFNPSTSISFDLSERSDVSLVVYNIVGQEVTRLVDGSLPAGHHTVSWQGLDHKGNPVASGVYLYRMMAGEYVDVKKMMLLR